jgi:adenine-specific DNA-methyltransferase
MAGTGLFSLALRREGYRVIASDVMTYSYHHLVVNLKLNHAPKFDGLKGILHSFIILTLRNIKLYLRQ